MILERRGFILSLGASILFASTASFSWAQSASLDASVAQMVDEAAASIEKQGLKDARKNTPPDTWAQKSSGLYIFVFNSEGFLVLHPDKRVIGANIRNIRDVQGNAFIARILKALGKSGSTFWSEYLWVDPFDGKTRKKRVFSRKTGDLIINCGYYLDQA